MNQLKEAEKKATLIVQEARKGKCFALKYFFIFFFRRYVFQWYDFSARGDKMKEAKSEAERIINAYRAEMEVSYQVSLAKVSSNFLIIIIIYIFKVIDTIICFYYLHYRQTARAALQGQSWSLALIRVSNP